MDLNLEGKVAVVTGGSAGIGLACAWALFSEGAHVVVAAHQGVDEAANSIRKDPGGDGHVNEIIPVLCDLSKAEAAQKVVKATLDRFGKIDILVNCAGAARAGAFLELNDEDFQDAWNLKLLGYIRMVKAVAPHMIKQKNGSIINIIGAAGKTPPSTFLTGSTTNAALINFTKGISKELALHNVRINAISPAATETERARQLAEQTAKAKNVGIEEVVADSTRNIPIGRMIKPSEVAWLATFLVSERAASITGTEVLIDGGSTPGV